MKFFASFRVFRESILLMRRYSSDRSKKTKDSRLVLLSRCSMQIDVPSVRHEPNFFRISRALNKHACVGGSRVSVIFAVDDEHRALDVFDVTQLRG